MSRVKLTSIEEPIKAEEIIVSAHPVKYNIIEYCEGYIVVQQHRTRRRVTSGSYFEDTGMHIYISVNYSYIFQHKNKTRQFILNTITKEWRDAVSVSIHRPDYFQPLDDNSIDSLRHE